MDWLTNTFWDTFGFWNSSVMGFTKLINYFSQESPVHSFCLSTTVSLHIYKGCMGFPGGARGKEPTCQCRRPKRRGFTPWVRKILWRRAWQPTPVFLPGGARQATVHSTQRIGPDWSDLAPTHVLLKSIHPTCHRIASVWFFWLKSTRDILSNI